jgi:hypothetical protein
MEMDWVVGANLNKGNRSSITWCVQHQRACCRLIARHSEAKYVRRRSQRSLARIVKTSVQPTADIRPPVLIDCMWPILPGRERPFSQIKQAPVLADWG